MTALFLPALVVLLVLLGLSRRVNVYEAFVCGAREGLLTLASIAPNLCAILTATALLRGSGAMDALLHLLSPVFSFLGLPGEAAAVALLRPFSASAALGAAAEVMDRFGADSRAGLAACIIGAAGETVFFTAALYLGGTGVRRSRYALPAALLAYALGVATAGLFCR